MKAPMIYTLITAAALSLPAQREYTLQLDTLPSAGKTYQPQRWERYQINPAVPLDPAKLGNVVAFSRPSRVYSPRPGVQFTETKGVFEIDAEGDGLTDLIIEAQATSDIYVPVIAHINKSGPCEKQVFDDIKKYLLLPQKPKVKA
jgi:hypothetical protein